MQDSRSLIDALIRKEPAERVGVFENIWRDTLRRWVGEGYPTDDRGRPVDPALELGFDIAGAGGGFNHQPLMGPAEVLEESEEWIVRRNGSGAALKYWKNKSGTPEHIDFRMTTRAVWERDYRPHLLELNPDRISVEATRTALATRREQEKWCMWGKMFVWEGMRQSMGDICMYESLVLDPGWVHDYCRVITDLYKTHYKVLIEEAGKPDGFRMCEDLGYHKGLFCSPRVLAELIMPYFAELVDFFHSYDIPVILHTCGGVAEALDMIVDAGFDGMDPMEVKAGCDPFEFADKVGGRLMLRGGLDVRILESGDRDLMRREISALIQGMKARGARYMFSSDHSISSNVAYDDYLYALEVYREHMFY